MVGMGIFCYKAVKQLEKYQAIADAYAQLDTILEEEREKSQKEAAAELGEFISDMEADAERYRQEYETEMREKGLEVYDWDALCSENKDIKGWLCIPDTLINFPVVGTDDNAFYLSHDFTDACGSATACQIMAVAKYSIDDLEEWDFRIRNHADMESYNAWMEELQGRALYLAEPDHAPASIITLATCDRRIHGKNGRFLVVAGKIAG